MPAISTTRMPRNGPVPWPSWYVMAAIVPQPQLGVLVADPRSTACLWPIPASFYGVSVRASATTRRSTGA
jgi:hypothetical protein